jgi:indolepyruvate ferredoxin oxidoreductase alpha subunit
VTRFVVDCETQQAWKVAEQLGWETTYAAEYVALTRLQADVFVTSDRDLAEAVTGLVATATPDVLV